MLWDERHLQDSKGSGLEWSQLFGVPPGNPRRKTMLQQLSRHREPCQWGITERTGGWWRRAWSPVTGESFRTGTDAYCWTGALWKSCSLSGPDRLSGARAAAKIWPGTVRPRAAARQLLDISGLSSLFLPTPHSRSTLRAQVATGSLLPAALLPFSRWVAVFFLFYVFYFLSCCQSKPLLKPA